MGVTIIRWLSIGLFVAGSIAQAHAEFPPKGFVIHENSTSPDGRYAVLAPTSESLPEGVDTPDVPNHLADLKAKRLLGRIKNTSYIENSNRRDLQVIWSEDSTWCVLVSSGRFAFGGITVVELDGARFRETPIEERVNQALERELAKQKEGGIGESSAFVRLTPERKLRLRATANNNPKRSEDRKTRCALFQGTYDVTAKTWGVTDARTITEDEHDLLFTAYAPLKTAGRDFQDDAERARWLDEELNAVYKAIRLLVPAERFAAVKKEQIAWLKEQRKDAPPKEVCAAWTERIQVLEKLLW